MTTDKLRSLVKKWQTLIECFTEVKTTDGFVLRIFCIAFTKKRPNQIRKTSYAQTSQVICTHARIHTTLHFKFRCSLVTDQYIIKIGIIQRSWYKTILTMQIRDIRKKMVEVIQRESACELKELVGKFIPESISKEIEKACSVSKLTPAFLICRTSSLFTTCLSAR